MEQNTNNSNMQKLCRAIDILSQEEAGNYDNSEVDDEDEEEDMLKDALLSATQMLANQGVDCRINMESIHRQSEDQEEEDFDESSEEDEEEEEDDGDDDDDNLLELQSRTRFKPPVNYNLNQTLDDMDESEDDKVGVSQAAVATDLYGNVDFDDDEDEDYHSEGHSSDDEYHLRSIQASMREAAGFSRAKRGKIKPAKKPKGKKKKKRPVPRKPTYSPEVQRLLGMANQFYVNQQLQKAADAYGEVIRLEPSCSIAWSSLSTIREEEGEFEMALQLLVAAAHLKPSNNELWKRVYGMYMEKASENKPAADAGDQNAKAEYEYAISYSLYCLNKIVRNEPDNSDYWEQRFAILASREDWKRLRMAYRAKINIDPYDFATIKDAATMMTNHLDDLVTVVPWYERAFEYYENLVLDMTQRAVEKARKAQGEGDTGEEDEKEEEEDDDDDDDEEEDESGQVSMEWAKYYLANPDTTISMSSIEDGYTYNELNVFSELRIYRLEYEKALTEIKRGTRFIEGFGRSRYPDSRELQRIQDIKCEDDEEFVKLAGPHFPGELRAKMAQCRIMLGHGDTAKMHVDYIIQNCPASEYSDLYTAVAKSYVDHGDIEVAIGIYRLLDEDPDLQNAEVLDHLAKCYRELDNLELAAEYAERVLEEDPEDIDMCLWLSEVYGEMGWFKMAYEMIGRIEEIQTKQLQTGLSTLGDSQPPATVAKESQVGAAKDAVLQATNPLPSDNVTRRRKNLEEKRRSHIMAIRDAVVTFNKLDLLARKIEEGEDVNDTTVRTTSDAVKEYCRTAGVLYESWRRINAFYLTDISKPFRSYRNALLDELEASAQAKSTDILSTGVEERLSRLRRRLSQKKHLGSRHPKSHVVQDEEEDDETAQIGTYRGQPFSRWFEMFLSFGKYLAMDDRPGEALDMLQNVRISSVFRTQRDKNDIIQVLRMSIALNADMFDHVDQISRGWMGTTPTRAIVYKLLAYAMSTSTGAMEVLTSTKMYKFVYRQASKLRELYYQHATKDRLPIPEDLEILGDLPLGYPTEPEIEVVSGGQPLSLCDISALHSLVGHIYVISKSSIESLSHYSLALSLLPQDPSIALHLGASYLGLSIKRREVSSQAVAIRGMAYFQRYAELRCIEEQKKTEGRDPVVSQEIAYNMARAFHFLGLLDQAVEYYERVFELPVSVLAYRGEEREQARVTCDLAREAAYNLAAIYVGSGAVLKAKQVLMKHCTI